MAFDLPVADELSQDMPSACKDCSAKLCLRKQVVNLALGNVDTMSCLNCLGAQSNKSASQVLEQIVPYILSRDCFAKKWRNYKDSGTMSSCDDVCCSEDELRA